MIGFSLDYQGFDATLRSVHDLTYRVFDLRPLAERTAMIMAEQNLLTRSLGLDQYGVPFVPLADSTMKKRVRQGRLGPPLAPDFEASDIIGGFMVDVDAARPDDITVRGHWRMPWVKYHVDNGDTRHHLPVRDPAGLAPHAQDQVAVEFEDFIAGLVARTF